MVSEERKLAVMAAMPATKPEIREKLRIATETLRYTIDVLKQEGRCHVGGYVKDGRMLKGTKLIEEFHAGPGRDAPRTAEFIRQRQPKSKAPPAPTFNSRAPRRDPLVAALFGQP